MTVDAFDFYKNRTIFHLGYLTIYESTCKYLQSFHKFDYYLQ